MPKNKFSTKKIIYRICLTAVFLAFAVVSKFFFSIPIPLFGVNGLRVGFAGVFTIFPAILFGPLYGGAASGLSDIIGYLMKPEGAYIPWLTVTAFCGGCLKGLIWILIMKRKEIKFRVGVLI
ncbi:MAG: ECF transporter S component, partial [Oscillospiraceae bacterium]|nr:ECF transporter S component [Oscillospiraceae bacterium]